MTVNIHVLNDNAFLCKLDVGIKSLIEKISLFGHVLNKITIEVEREDRVVELFSEEGPPHITILVCREEFLNGRIELSAIKELDASSRVYTVGEGYLFTLAIENICKALEFFSSIFENLGERINERRVFKLFGRTREDIEAALIEVKALHDGITFKAEEELLDVRLTLTGVGNALELAYKKTFEVLRPLIYAESDISLFDALSELIRFNDIRLVLCEGGSGGIVTAALAVRKLKKDIISEVFTGVCDFTGGHVAVEINSDHVFDKAGGLLKKYGDVCVLVTAAMKDVPAEGAKVPVFVGFGNKKEMHIFKNAFSGTKEVFMKKLASYAAFIMVKRLRQK